MKALVHAPLAIASAAYRESMRQPATVVTLLTATTVIILSPNLGVFDLGEEYKIAVDTSLAALLLAGLFTVLFAASQTVSAELQSRTALTLLAKPVSWEFFLLGKFLGVAAAGLTAVLLLAVPVLVVTRLSAHPIAEHSAFLEPRATQAAEVSALEPSASLGQRNNLRVSGPPDERMIFLLFDTERTTTHHVGDVVLHLRWLGPDETDDPSATPPKGVTAYHVPDTLWSEEALTWDSRPRLARRLARLPEPEPSRVYKIPVSQYAADRRMLGIALKAPPGVNAYFADTDGPATHRTRLKLHYQTPADPARWHLVLGALLLWPLLSFLLVRRSRRSPYAAAACGYAIASLAAILLLSHDLGWEPFRIWFLRIPGWHLPGPLPLLGVPAAGWDWPLVQGICLIGMEILVLAAVGVAIATRAGRVWTFILTLLAFTAGHMAGGWATQLARGASAGRQALAASVLPNLEHFNLSDRVAHGEVLPAGLLLWAGVYMALYTAAALLVGMALIRGREVK